jgi:hypothetical protein
VDESQVIEVGTLDKEYQKQFSKPWIFQEEDGTTFEFSDEHSACYAQRYSRTNRGFNPWNGEKK